MLPSLIPDFTSFSDPEKKKLELLFDRTKDVELPSLREQMSNEDVTRLEIDGYFMEVLRPDMETSNRNRFLEELYRTILIRFDQMVEAMKSRRE